MKIVWGLTECPNLCYEEINVNIIDLKVLEACLSDFDVLHDPKIFIN